MKCVNERANRRTLTAFDLFQIPDATFNLATKTFNRNIRPGEEAVRLKATIEAGDYPFLSRFTAGWNRSEISEALALDKPAANAAKREEIFKAVRESGIAPHARVVRLLGELRVQSFVGVGRPWLASFTAWRKNGEPPQSLPFDFTKSPHSPLVFLTSMLGLPWREIARTCSQGTFVPGRLEGLYILDVKDNQNKTHFRFAMADAEGKPFTHPRGWLYRCFNGTHGYFALLLLGHGPVCLMRAFGPVTVYHRRGHRPYAYLFPDSPNWKRQHGRVELPASFKEDQCAPMIPLSALKNGVPIHKFNVYHVKPTEPPYFPFDATKPISSVLIQELSVESLRIKGGGYLGRHQNPRNQGAWQMALVELAKWGDRHISKPPTLRNVRVSPQYYSPAQFREKFGSERFERREKFRRFLFMRHGFSLSSEKCPWRALQAIPLEVIGENELSRLVAFYPPSIEDLARSDPLMVLRRGADRRGRRIWVKLPEDEWPHKSKWQFPTP